MVIDEESEGEGGVEAEAAGEDVAGNAYLESLTSVDGFKRGPNGRIKFNKDTKKRRREAEADEDVEMGDGEAAQKPSKKNKKKAEPKFGQEFKAKVSRLTAALSEPGVLTVFHRKREGTSKRTAWIRMHTCRFRRLRRSRTGVPASVSRASGERRCSRTHSLYATCSHRLWIDVLVLSRAKLHA